MIGCPPTTGRLADAAGTLAFAHRTIAREATTLIRWILVPFGSLLKSRISNLRRVYGRKLTFELHWSIPSKPPSLRCDDETQTLLIRRRPEFILDGHLE